MGSLCSANTYATIFRQNVRELLHDLIRHATRPHFGFLGNPSGTKNLETKKAQSGLGGKRSKQSGFGLDKPSGKGILFQGYLWIPDYFTLWSRQEMFADLRLRRRDLPNIISLLRLLAVMPVLYLLLEQEFGWALLLFTAAGLSDGLDGFLAKQYSWQSHLGGILDPLADKVLLVACFLVLGALSLIPVWLVSAVLFRDLLIVGGAVLYNYQVEEVEVAPTLVSKLNTVLQILLVVLVITNAGPMPLPGWIIQTLIWVCVATVIVSGSQYVWVWSRKAAQKGWKEN